jgi:hypothetical protein
MPLPNFLIIGAPKCGTTSLYEYLAQHPEVYMSPVKEPCYFLYAEAGIERDEVERQRVERERKRHCHLAGDLVTLPTEYRALFAGVTQEKAVGEASTSYIIYPNAAARIHHAIPHAKLIAVLRHPVERAFSAYRQLHRTGQTPYPNFEQAISAEDMTAPLPEAWEPTRFLRVGLYAQRLKPFFALFPREQIKILLYDDLKRDPLGLVKECYRFLEIDESFVPDVTQRHNVGLDPRSPMLLRFYQGGRVWRALRRVVPEPIRHWSQPLRAKLLYQPTSDLSPELYSRLMPLFREDILQLQGLLQRDLTHWLEGACQ